MPWMAVPLWWNKRKSRDKHTFIRRSALAGERENRWFGWYRKRMKKDWPIRIDELRTNTTRHKMTATANQQRVQTAKNPRGHAYISSSRGIGKYC